ncbi:hypothetical protein F5972_25255 [Microbispora cellulosiformans]|uniref:Uncharacterized protein n=1 Tax=Microbispora cellulosiformans TaxID=2614688 RepID=A0A5J5JZK9_9ACTN|nr:hypothetical protein [Microbispora cellulosiformans]KAA9376025.1 hypothetical protein F5972_25255 [Microbispora cellulosiformans]
MTSSPDWLSVGSPVLAKILDDLGTQTDLGAGRFVARNFLLEERPPDARTQRYVNVVGTRVNGTRPAEALEQLYAVHSEYILRNLSQGSRANSFDQEAADCPETFRGDVLEPDAGMADGNVELGRVEQVGRIGEDSGEGVDSVRSLLSRVAEGRRDGSPDIRAEKELRYLLQGWQQGLHNRPMRAFLWEDLESVLSRLEDGWPDKLRDRLGMIELDPMRRRPGLGIDICVFRYSIKRVPKGLTGRRLVLRPTIFDEVLSEAFCTSPPKRDVGHPVDLRGFNGLVREVVHPAINLRVEEVWAAGTVRRGVDPDIASARTLHLLKLAEFCDESFQDRFGRTDEDLFR